MTREVERKLRCEELNSSEPIDWTRLYEGYADLLIYTIETILHKDFMRAFAGGNERKKELYNKVLEDFKDVKNIYKNQQNYNHNNIFVNPIYDRAEKIIMNMVILLATTQEMNIHRWDSNFYRMMLVGCGRTESKKKPKAKAKYGLGDALLDVTMVFGAGGLLGVAAHKMYKDYATRQKLRDWISTNYFLYILKITMQNIEKTREACGYEW